ncbi:uncharacterized protein si:dkey-86e18.1 [Synchiropus splendidus]|uniref:uncharacterized protein si:dkey-86e18.1 n=1 Tax=Synchiropus splendidus TaxID=270530 RepID=UPI00237D66F5|nr:uncharacterized protein si:dkey-86e18.1 [Synchiropus splendidus]
MARNEEKQQGRLNRLWLQREREEGRLKDPKPQRPKLSTLNSASSVKKWIPSIKKEMEYCLQQSQLAHYPERKIAEFHLQIEALEKEYKSFIRKLHLLDPTCKDHPWTPRAYRKRRAEMPDSHSFGKDRKVGESPIAVNSKFDPAVPVTGEGIAVNENHVHPPFHPSVGMPKTDREDQDQPLSFDRARLAVATASFRGPSDPQSLSQSQKLTRMLQLSLPNLNSFSSGQTCYAEICESTGHRESNDAKAMEPLIGLKNSTMQPNTVLQPTEPDQKTDHVLGLGCYSSSEESDCET